MSLNKLQKFEALKTMPNVYENFSFTEPKLIRNNQLDNPRGKWKSQHFGNSNPLVLELACGKGEYAVALGGMFPNKNFIGIDIKGNRIHNGARIALEKNLLNVCFLRTKIELLHEFMDGEEIDEIWITFPDPFPSFSDRGNRLISPKFLDYYKKLLNGKKITFHLKTDNFPLFRYAVGVLDGRGERILRCLENIYGNDKKIDDILKVQTYYERLHAGQGSQIHYVKWEM
ncbi:MAG: tRNA (guanosine(46)-N7)-methyltransferase TrmB [Chitinophagales bacterium]|jgi:tRNA (guanine-N7-)-methyltransferase|nr:tRNA (guanosine(46)-N7)-methyltransferase TrmB [Sphingobacteriales bacterium]